MMRSAVAMLWSVCAMALVAVEDEAQEPPPSPWSHTLRIGMQFSNVASQKAETSRDQQIAASNDRVTWRARVDGNLTWREDRHMVDQTLRLLYGQTRERGDSWDESADEIYYDGVYDITWSKPHLTYLRWGAESVFVGPEPDEEPLDPLVARVSAGYGQRFEDLLPMSDVLMYRVGVRAQKRWGRNLGEDRDPEVGIEALIRYRRQQTESIRYFAQYEFFAEFEDMGHTTHLLTAGAEVKLNAALTVELNLRGYYETEPRNAPADSTGYDEFSLRQELLVGFIYEF